MEDYFEFLNDLRDSGSNQYVRCAPVLQEVFGLDKYEDEKSSVLG